MITYCRRNGSRRVNACHLTCIPYLPRTCRQQLNIEQLIIRTQCIVYADDLAIYCHSVNSLQACLENLLVYCTSNLLKVNVSKTKIAKFRRGGRLSRNDKLIYNNQEVDFVYKFKYLGVMFQTKGGNSEHLEMLKRKGIRGLSDWCRPEYCDNCD